MILKIILGILLVLILLILYILIAPFRIQVRLVKHRGEELFFVAKVMSPLHLFRAIVLYSNKLHYRVGILENGPAFVQDKPDKEESDEDKSGDKDSNHPKKKLKSKDSTEKKKSGNIKSLPGRIIDFIKFLLSNDGKAGISTVWNAIIKAINGLDLHFRKSEVSFSTGEPDKTGILLGVLSMVKFTHSKGLKLTPDFVSDDAYFDGQMELVGHIIIGKLLILFLRTISDRNVKQIIEEVRRLRNG